MTSMLDVFEKHKYDPSIVTMSRTWFRQQAALLKKEGIRPNRMYQYSGTLATSIKPGSMYMFFYDPKLKQELPYYDRFPLVFPIEIYQDGFLGINLHYLPHRLRANLMDALYMTINNKRNDTTTKLRITYEIMKSSSRMRYFKPCLKRYLAGHVLQKFIYIDPKDWDKALMLPTERFVKQSKQYVHTESVRSIRGK